MDKPKLELGRRWGYGNEVWHCEGCGIKAIGNSPVAAFTAWKWMRLGCAR